MRKGFGCGEAPAAIRIITPHPFVGWHAHFFFLLLHNSFRSAQHCSSQRVARPVLPRMTQGFRLVIAAEVKISRWISNLGIFGVHKRINS
jgi:hypothetical protein